MRIAMLSTPFITVPPVRYGGTELVVAELSAGLERLGHEVRLYTVGDASRTSAPFADTRALYRTPVWPPDPYCELNHSAWAIADLLADDESVDLIHAHCPTAVPLARFAGLPLVYTIHHPRLAPLAASYRVQCATQRGLQFVCVSGRQLELLPEVASCATVVHHGLDPDRYPLGGGGVAAAFLGRLAREKGPHLALEAARRARVPLRMAGQAHAEDERWFRAELEPRLHAPEVEWIGEVDHRRKLALLQNARATLFPIEWEEPFGLVMIESMLCGTPVLAFGRGSVPELVDEGVTGWVCADVEEMAARLVSLDGDFNRLRCRSHAIERFGRARMVEGYLRVYQRALEEGDLALADPRRERRIDDEPTGRF